MRFHRPCTLLALAFALTSAADVPPPVALHIVDSATNSPIPDLTVTLGNEVLASQPSGDYKIPAASSQIMLRAPGYKAVTYTAAQISNLKGKLTLTPFEVHSLYITEYGINSAALRDPILRIMHAGGANALTINIKTDYGLLDYPSQIPLAQQIGARKMTTIHSLSDLVNAGHAQGIYMIARIVTFKDLPLATTHPEWAIHLANGELFYDHSHLAWADPWRKEVRAYNIAIAVEAAKAGFDEVQFDYVRFPDSNSKLVVSGPTDEAGRVKAITSFLTDAHKALIPYNVFQSADIFGYDSWNTNDTGIGQHLEDIVPAVDYVCPMLYPSGFRYGIPGHPKPMDTLDDIYANHQRIPHKVHRSHPRQPQKVPPLAPGLPRLRLPAPHLRPRRSRHPDQSLQGRQVQRLEPLERPQRLQRHRPRRWARSSGQTQSRQARRDQARGFKSSNHQACRQPSSSRQACQQGARQQAAARQKNRQPKARHAFNKAVLISRNFDNLKGYDFSPAVQACRKAAQAAAEIIRRSAPQRCKQGHNESTSSLANPILMKKLGFLSFGHWTPSPQSQTRSAADVLLQSIDLAIEAERLGLDGAYFRVHHFARQLASPFPLLAAIGTRTNTIEIGTGVIDMRYENPHYMLEDAGAADLISNGRLQLGISRGSPEQVIDGWRHFGYAPPPGEDDAALGRLHAEQFLDLLNGQGFAQPNPRPMFPNPPGLLRLEPFPAGLRDRIWWGASSNATAVWAATLGMNLQSSTLKLDETGEPFHVQQAAQIRAFRAAWKDAGHTRTPRVSVSRSIFALVNDLDRAYFGRGADEEDKVGFLDARTRAIFGRGYAAEPDVLVQQLRQDEAIAEADTLLLTVPNQLGVAYNAHVLESILTTIAPALGWR